MADDAAATATSSSSSRRPRRTAIALARAVRPGGARVSPPEAKNVTAAAGLLCQLGPKGIRVYAAVAEGNAWQRWRLGEMFRQKYEKRVSGRDGGSQTGGRSEVR